MQISFKGRKVVVAGGSRGIGRSIALQFAAAGADVSICARGEASLAQAAGELRAHGGAVHTAACDLADGAAVVGYVKAAAEALGGIDVLVNNAGMSPVACTSLETSEELFDKVLSVNLKGPFRLSALVGTRMAAGEGGSIVNISSAAAIHPRPHTLPYAAAKAGLNALTVGLAHTFGPSVRVNAIMAGTFLTDVSRSWDPEVFARRAEGFALRRGGQPEEIVGTALYLASDLSSYTTGAVITVDGGQP